MVEYKDVMVGVALVAATVAGFGLVFLAIVTATFIASPMVRTGFLMLAVPAVITTASGMVAGAAAIWWLVNHAGAQGYVDAAYAVAVWGALAMGVIVILTALWTVLVHAGAKEYGRLPPSG